MLKKLLVVLLLLMLMPVAQGQEGPWIEVTYARRFSYNDSSITDHCFEEIVVSDIAFLEFLEEEGGLDLVKTLLEEAVGGDCEWRGVRVASEAAYYASPKYDWSTLTIRSAIWDDPNADEVFAELAPFADDHCHTLYNLSTKDHYGLMDKLDTRQQFIERCL